MGAAGRLGAAFLQRRAFARAPIWLFRADLGGLFGGRLLLLEHVGRATGQARHVVLEVVERRDDGYVVASGFGGRAQWYRDVVANPRTRVTVTGRRAVPAVAEVLTPAEAVATLRRYVEQHPRAWRTLRGVLTEVGTLPKSAGEPEGTVDDDELGRVPLVLLRTSGVPPR